MNQMHAKKETEDLRYRSGTKSSESKLVSFLYSLLRDGLPAGIVEQFVMESTEEDNTVYTNGYLLEYAKDIAARLTAAPPQPPDGHQLGAK